MKISLPCGTITARKDNTGHVAELHAFDGELVLEYHSPEEDKYDAFGGLIADILLEPEYAEYRSMIIDALADNNRSAGSC